MNSIIRLASLTATAFLAAASTACTDGTAVADPANPPANPPTNNQGIVAGTLEATAKRPTLTLRNTTEHVVGYLVMEKNMMVVALFPPCGPQCPQLAQGQQVALPYTSINGYTNAATEVMVMWWTYTRAADGTLQPIGGMQSKTVRL
jgi:hypothetical protein